MTACDATNHCRDCGDRLIHQSNRGLHESSSEFGQFIHDLGERDRAWREMWWLDVDGVIYRKSTGVLRVIEHKPVGGSLSAGQKAVFELLAKGIQLLAATGLLHRQSGVFAVWSDHPHDVLSVQQIPGWALRWKTKKPVQLAGQQRDDFLRGEVVAGESESLADTLADAHDVFTGEEFET